MKIIENDELIDIGVPDVHKRLVELCASTAELTKLHFEAIERPSPQLARDFWLDANPERSRFEITSIEEQPDAFLISYTIDYFDTKSIEGTFLWLPALGNKRLAELFLDIRAHYS